MATLVGGIGASHSPTIGFAKDAKKQDDPAWSPIFAGFDQIRAWVNRQRIDVIFMIYNDHVTSFFFDHYSAFALGIDDSYRPADEGGGPRNVPPARGDAAFARHIGASLMSDEFDLSFFQGKALDHGCLSPLGMLSGDEGPWGGAIIPLNVGVLQFPIPTAMRCYKLGKALRRAIESYPEDLRVAVMATGGLSHQVHGERAGFINEAWDDEFLDLLEHDPQQLAELTIAEYAERGGFEGSEVIMWLIMRGALSERVRLIHKATYAPSATNIATLVFEDLDSPAPEVENARQRARIGHEMAGAEKLPGTYPFTQERSHANLRVNGFLHRLVEPAHRARFQKDFESLADEYGLTEDEKALIRDRRWLDMVKRGVSFFMLEKLAAVTGVPNPAIYASFRGETLEQYLASRKAQITYGVAATK